METARLQLPLAAQIKAFSLPHRRHDPGKRRAYASNSRQSKLSSGLAYGRPQACELAQRLEIGFEDLEFPLPQFSSEQGQDVGDVAKARSAPNIRGS
jgi:hypothetical protein